MSITSVVRVAPEQALIIERHQFVHHVDSRQQVEAADCSGSVDLSFCYNATKDRRWIDARNRCEPELAPTNGRREESKSSPTSLRVGMVKLPGARRCQPVDLPANDLTARLVRRDTVKMELPFTVPRLRTIPLRIEADVLDEQRTSVGSSDFETHEFNDQLYLRLRVSLEIPEEALRRAHGLARAVRQVLSGENKVTFVGFTGDAEESLDNIGEALCRLCNQGGGLLILGIEADKSVRGLEDARADTLFRMIEDAALKTSPPIAVDEPVKVDVDGRLVVIVQARPKSGALVAGKGYVWGTSTVMRAAYDVAADCYFGGEAILSESDCLRYVKQGTASRVAFVPTLTFDISRIQASLANAGGGVIFYGVKSGGKGRPGEILGVTTAGDKPDPYVAQVQQRSHERVPRTEPTPIKVGDRWLLYQRIASDSRDLYSAPEGFERYDGVASVALTNREALALLRSRQTVEGSILPQPEPVVRRCTLEWLDFPADTDTYNPELGRIEWTNERFSQNEERNGSFRCDLFASISRSRELFAKGRLKGSLVVDINGVLLATSECQYFNADGLRDDVNMEAVSRLSSELSVTLTDLLRRRPYYPSRSLSVYGVEPRQERIQDIVRVLNNVGLMVRRIEPLDGVSLSLENGIRLRGEKQGRRGVTHMDCYVQGTPNAVRRTLRRGDRTDDKRLRSGAIHFNFVADTEEENQDIVSLLNDVVEMIHRRLRFVRVE